MIDKKVIEGLADTRSREERDKSNKDAYERMRQTNMNISNFRISIYSAAMNALISNISGLRPEFFDDEVFQASFKKALKTIVKLTIAAEKEQSQE